LRLFQYIPYLREAKIDVDTSFLFSNTMLKRRYTTRNYRRKDLLVSYWRRVRALLQVQNYDLILIEKDALPWLPNWIEGFLLRKTRYVLDFDDAQFHRYDDHYSRLIRFFYAQKIDRLMAKSHLVIAGNKYISDRCTAAGAQWIEIIPTVVDLDRYAPKQTFSDTKNPRIVWIGTPETMKFLELVLRPLTELAKRRSFTLRLIGVTKIDMPGVPIELLPWSSDTECEMISNCDIGIMPLTDAPWERGKCAYKLIQYMACALPVIASPVGANSDVVIDGVTGFLARSDGDWLEKLEQLLDSAELRQRIGAAGRLRVESNYCLQKSASTLINLLGKASI
jgi:glycosyltransferase involved in cell wall biosynthesis